MNIKKLSRNTIVIIAVAAFALSALGVYAASSWSQTNPNTATGTNPTFTASISLAGSILPEGQTIAWGTVEPSQTYTRALSIQNTGTQPLLFTVQTSASLPAGFTLTLTGNNNNPLPAGSTAAYTLTLTTGATVPNGALSWVTTITGA